MRYIRRQASHAPKPLLLQLSVVILVVLLPIWFVQQQNVNHLEQQITALRQKVENPKLAIQAKDQLALEKDLLLVEKDHVIAQNAIYTTLVQALGGAFFFITAYLTWRNVKATEEKQVTERFSKAIEQLGSDKLEVRLGGIYSLERIAKDSTKDHWTVVEVLTSFILSRSTIKEPADSQPQDLEEFTTRLPGAADLYEQRPISLDVRAALTVIGRREASQDPSDENQTLNLAGCNFCGFSLSNTNFSRARLSNTFWGPVNLQKANFEEAVLSAAQFRQANLTEAIFTKAWLTQANLSYAIIANADLREAEIAGAKLKYTNFKKANLSKAKLFQAELYCADFSEAVLTGADLTEAILTKANLTGANLSGADLTRAVGLIQEQINQAIISRDTKLPDYLQQSQAEQPQSD